MAQARTLHLKGDKSGAESEFRQSILAGCDEVETHRELAEMFEGYQQYEKAIEEYRSLLSKDDTDVRGHWALAKLLVFNRRDYEKGLAETLTTRNLLDKNDRVFIRETEAFIGTAYDGLGNTAEAIKHYEIFLDGCNKTPLATPCVETKKRVLELKKAMTEFIKTG